MPKLKNHNYQIIRKGLTQINKEKEFFKKRYTNPIIIDRYQSAIGDEFDAKIILENITKNIEFVPFPLKPSKIRKNKYIQETQKSTACENNPLEVLLTLHGFSGILGVKVNTDEISSRVFGVLNSPGLCIHELSHCVNIPSITLGSALKASHKEIYNSLVVNKSSVLILLKYMFYLIASMPIFYYFHIFGNSQLYGVLPIVIFFFKELNSLENLNYYYKSCEIHSRAMEIRYFLDKKPEEKISLIEIESVANKKNSLLRLTKSLKKRELEQNFVDYINTTY